MEETILLRSQDDFLENGRLRGRGKQYHVMDGYGFIYSKGHKDVFFSSYNFVEKEDEQKRCHVGSEVEFSINIVDGKPCATDIIVSDPFPVVKQIVMPNGENMSLKRIRKFGVTRGIKALEIVGITAEELISNGHDPQECSFLFISTTKGEYRFFNNDSFIAGDGKCDIEAYYQELKNVLLEY